jgi:hypothetical protein
MIRSRRWSALAFLLLPLAMLLSPLVGEAPLAKEPDAGKKSPEKWLLDRTLALTPAPAPVPAFKYRLYPLTSERKEGNAVPLYLRFAHERSDARKKELREKPEQWNKLPLEKLPLEEVKKYVESYKYNYKQLDLGARRKTADWNYTLDAGDVIGILLPDAQEMRIQAPLLVLKARLEIAEGRYADAVHTLETSFSFSQQINEGPFLITSLVAIACASQFADCLLELMERPDAPNLYWALTVLPRPLISMRNPDEYEQKILEMQFPDMAELDRPRSAEDWDAALKRVRQEIERFDQYTKKEEEKIVRPGTSSKDPAAKSPDLPEARKYLAQVIGMSAARIDAMPPAEVLLLYLSNYYHELRDEVFKSTYLPFPQGWSVSEEAEKRLKSVAKTEAGRLVRAFLPAIPKVQLAQVRLERKLEALRAIEALRMHAAANGGRLPTSFAEVKIAPVPDDPGTGRPFEYQCDGTNATLTSRLAGQPLNTSGLRYRITIRK